jgi:hypothetical protein
MRRQPTTRKIRSGDDMTDRAFGRPSGVATIALMLAFALALLAFTMQATAQAHKTVCKASAGHSKHRTSCQKAKHASKPKHKPSHPRRKATSRLHNVSPTNRSSAATCEDESESESSEAACQTTTTTSPSCEDRSEPEQLEDGSEGCDDGSEPV